MPRNNGVTRRRLTIEQQREIARLYGEAGIPTGEIRERFGIGESSVYRVLQKQGVSLRGRAAARSDGLATGAPTRGAGRGRGRPRRNAPVDAHVQAANGTAMRRDAAALEFRVRFDGQRVFQARDIRDALRQAEAFGATSIVEATRLA